MLLGFHFPSGPSRDATSIWCPSRSHKHCFPFIHMYMQQGGRFPPPSVIAKWWQSPLSTEGTKEHTLFKRSTSRTRTVFANSGEGNLPGSSLTIYFHRRSANQRQAKFVSFACHGVGSVIATLPVGAPRDGVWGNQGWRGEPWGGLPLHSFLLTHDFWKNLVGWLLRRWLLKCLQLITFR